MQQIVELVLIADIGEYLATNLVDGCGIETAGAFDHGVGDGAAKIHGAGAAFFRASVVEDPTAVSAQQQRLLARYQPEGGFKPLDPADPLYQGALAQLAAVRLEIVRRRTKFKLGQNRTAEARRRVIEELRKRGRPNDHRAADALQWTIDVQRV